MSRVKKDILSSNNECELERIYTDSEKKQLETKLKILIDYELLKEEKRLSRLRKASRFLNFLIGGVSGAALALILENLKFFLKP